MGASESKNTAEEIANITNTIAQTTNTDQVNDSYVVQTVNLNQCKITADNFQVNQQAQNIVNAKQLSYALQQSVIQNDITEQLAQEAKSKMGALGVGYASASNSASTTANATNEVKNAMNSTLDNLVDVSNTFTCNGSDITLKGDLTINQGTFTSIITDQSATNTQISNLANSITQDISQKASATVQGIGGVLLLFLLIIGAIIFIIVKTTGGVVQTSGKIAMYTMIPVLIVGIFILFVWMASVQAPPLFTAPNIISPYAFSGQNGANVPAIVTEDDLIDTKFQYLSLKNPPLYYLYNIYTNTEKGCLLYIVINLLLGVNNDNPNHGYNCRDMNTVNQNFQTFVRQTLDNIKQTTPSYAIEGDFPDLLICCQNCDFTKSSDGVDYTQKGNMVYNCLNCQTGYPVDSGTYQNYSAIPNVDGFTEFCNESMNNKLFARFVLSEYFGFYTNYYVNDGDPVTWIDESYDQKYYGIANDSNRKYISKIIQKEGYDPAMAMQDNTTLYGMFGIQPTTTYNVSQGFKRWGIYIFIIFIVCLCIWIGLTAARMGAKTSRFLFPKKKN